MNVLSVLAVVSLLSQTPAPAVDDGDMDPELARLLRELEESEQKKETVAERAWKAVVVKAADPSPDCAALISPSTRYTFGQLELKKADVAKDAAAYLTLARCAEKQKYFGFMADLGVQYAAANPKTPHFELLVRAALGAGLNDVALELVNGALEKFPDDPDLLLGAAKVRCRLRDWKVCREYADLALARVETLKGDERDQLTARITKYQTRAELHLGNLDESNFTALLMEMYKGNDEDLETLKQQLTSAKLNGLVVEPQLASHLALGTYHLAGRIKSVPPPVRVYLTNVGEDRQVRVEATLQGLSTTATKTVTLRKGKEALVEFTPQLLPTFKSGSVRATRPTNLALKVTALTGKKPTIVYEDTTNVDVEPRDFLPMFKQVDAETSERENAYFAAWVTPNAKAIDTFLAKAKRRSPEKSFSRSAATLPQVKALFEELKARGMSYVSDPRVNSGLGFGQRTRLPSEVLTSTNAQCLEGSLLYASLLEAIGLSPVVVLVPGHAFVGWRSTVEDGAKAPDVYYLETTMTGTDDFTQAQLAGQREFEHHHKRRGAISVRISQLRDDGVTPQPME